jgi:hypothetical protein
MKTVKEAGKHRYSIASLVFVTLDVLVSFGLMSHWYLGPALAPESPAARRLALVSVGLGYAATGLGVLAVIKDQGKVLAIASLAASLSALILCGLRFAV